MKKLTDTAIKVLTALLDAADEHGQGERSSVNMHTEDLNVLVGGPKVAFRDEAVLRECAEWCEENGLPLLTMMISADSRGEFPDEMSSNLAFKFGIVPSRADRKKAWIAEREEIAILDGNAIEAAKEALNEAVQSMDAAKAPSSRRALANARNQEVEAKSLEEWLARYQEVLDVAAPGQPLIHNDFMDSQEGYKERAWERWREELSFDEWAEDCVGSGEIVSKLQPTLDDGDANWITKRYGGFDLAAKLAEKVHGIEEFERAAYGFYVGDLVAREFFEKAVALFGRQYSVVSHLMFLKDKDAYVPVKPDAFEAGLRKLGVEFYLSGFCSWDNYTRFLGYLERIRQMLLEIDSGTTLLDAHSILWIIGSGYWFDGGGAEIVARMRDNVPQSSEFEEGFTLYGGHSSDMRSKQSDVEETRLEGIDVHFDFTTDTPGFWDGFWEFKDGLGGSEHDPDSLSPTLRQYHRLLWSKELPNGQTMELVDDLDGRYGYLKWNDMKFGSDSITTSFRYRRYREVIDQVAASVLDYHAFVEDYLHRSYTIGGMIIFPKHQGSMNQARGVSAQVSDRWDLTLECIRLHYAGKDSPLAGACERDRDFFDLFVDFEGYVDFFMLQDCIEPATGNVRIWLGKGDFSEDPRPKNVPEYLAWIQSQLDFVEARNERIRKAISGL